AINDNPMLIARDVPTQRPLLRIVLDRDLRLPPASRLVQTARQYPLAVYCSEPALKRAPHAAKSLTAAGVMVAPLPPDSNQMLSLPILLKDLPARVTHLLVEPGPTLARSFLDQAMADRVWIIRSPLVIGETLAPRAAAVPWPAVGEVELGPDLLSEYYEPRSP